MEQSSSILSASVTHPPPLALEHAIGRACLLRRQILVLAFQLTPLDGWLGTITSLFFFFLL
jgi:hypothetical protein